MPELTVNQMKWMFNTEPDRVEKWCRETGNLSHLEDILEAHRQLRDEILPMPPDEEIRAEFARLREERKKRI